MRLANDSGMMAPFGKDLTDALVRSLAHYLSTLWQREAGCCC